MSQSNQQDEYDEYEEEEEYNPSLTERLEDIGWVISRFLKFGVIVVAIIAGLVLVFNIFGGEDTPPQRRDPIPTATPDGSRVVRSATEMYCPNLANIVRDARDGILTDGEIRVKLKEVMDDFNISFAGHPDARELTRASRSLYASATPPLDPDTAALEILNILTICEKYDAL